MYIPTTRWTWAFLITVLVQAAVILVMEAYVFAAFQQSLTPGPSSNSQSKTNSQSRTIATYLTLFIFGLIYELILVYDSLRLKNTIQVIGLCLYNLAMLICAAIQVDQINNAVATLHIYNYIVNGESTWRDIKPYLIAAPCVIALATVLMSVIAWKLYEEFAWTIYKHISADLKMKQRFLTFQIYIALLKFDFFFFLGFTVQFVVVVSALNVEFYLTIFAVPVTILILVMAGYWTRRENKYGMLLIIALYLAGSAYFIFKLVRIYQTGYRESYTAVKNSLTGFGAITLILIALTIINASLCMANFGKGLKPFVLKHNIGEEEEKADLNMTELPGIEHGQIPSRMTID